MLDTIHDLQDDYLTSIDCKELYIFLVLDGSSWWIMRGCVAPAHHEKRVYDTMGGISWVSQRTGVRGEVWD